MKRNKRATPPYRNDPDQKSHFLVWVRCDFHVLAELASIRPKIRCRRSKKLKGWERGERRGGEWGAGRVGEELASLVVPGMKWFGRRRGVEGGEEDAEDEEAADRHQSARESLSRRLSRRRSRKHASLGAAAVKAQEQAIIGLLQQLGTLRETEIATGRATRPVLLLEGEFAGEPVFVRDILLVQSQHFDGDITAVDETVRRVTAFRHPHVTRVLFSKVENGERLIVMAEKWGESVADKINKSRSLFHAETLTKEDVLEIAIDVCEGATFLHENSMAGINLKPSSIFHDDHKGSYVLGESCLSPLFRGAWRARNRTNANSTSVAASPRSKSNGVSKTKFKDSDDDDDDDDDDEFDDYEEYLDQSELKDGGSADAVKIRDISQPEYLSIEELAGARKLTPKSDVFVFGMLLWQLLHLKMIYPMDWGVAKILRFLDAGNRPHIDTSVVGIDHPLRRIVERCWAADPEQRPNFDEVRSMLIIAKQCILGSMPTGGFTAELLSPISSNTGGDNSDAKDAVAEKKPQEPIEDPAIQVQKSATHKTVDETSASALAPEQPDPEAPEAYRCNRTWNEGDLVWIWWPRRRDFVMANVRTFDNERNLVEVVPVTDSESSRTSSAQGASASASASSSSSSSTRRSRQRPVVIDTRFVGDNLSTTPKS